MRPFLLSLIVAAVTTPAPAATLRPMTTLSAPTVLLSDLFDDAGPQANRVLGPGPGPGERIVVGATQLEAIARQFGVDWRPASSGERAVLEQPGRLLPRETLLNALHAALVRLGAPEASELDLPDLATPLVPVLAQPRALVEQLNYEAGADHFSASVLVEGSGMSPLRLQMSGRIEEMVEVAVPARRLAAGSVVRAADLMMSRVRASALRGEVARDFVQAVGLAPRRAMQPGQPLPLAELSRPVAVAKGARVALELRAPGLIVLAQGVAMEAGALGDRIQAMNPTSRMVVEGEIVGRDRVRVDQGSNPAPADAQVAAQ